jgi:hypothetical protein
LARGCELVESPNGVDFCKKIVYVVGFCKEIFELQTIIAKIVKRRIKRCNLYIQPQQLLSEQFQVTLMQTAWVLSMWRSMWTKGSPWSKLHPCSKLENGKWKRHNAHN